MIRKVFLLIFTLLLISFVANLQAEPSGHWEFSGWYGGGCYPAIISDPNVKDRAYLLSDVAGLWRSDNKGDKWYFINDGLINLHIAVLAIAPSNSDIVYIGTKAGIMRSDNAGKTWRYLISTKDKIIFERPENYRCIAIDPRNPNMLFVGTKSGKVLFSNNGGKTWQRFSNNRYPFRKKTHITALHLSCDSKKLFVASEFGLMQYDVQQKIWSKIKVGYRKIYDMVSLKKNETIYVTAGKQAAYSSDYGETWYFTKPIPYGEIVRLSAQEDRMGNIKLLAGWRDGWEGGVFLSLDNGRTWRDIERNLKYDESQNPTRVWTKNFGRVNSVVFDTFDQNTIYFTDWWGAWRSNNNGRSWNEKIYGAPNTVGSDIHITSQGEIYVATMDNGLLRSTDGGKSYKPLFPKKGYRKDINGHVWRIITNPKNPKNVIATSSPWDENVNQVIISQDGGVNFITVRDGLPARRPRINTMWEKGYPKAITLDPKRPDIIYLGIDGDDGGGLFISHDGGWHWKHSKGQPGSRRIYNALAVDPTNFNRLFWGAYGKRGGVYVTEDNGESWECVFNRMTEIFDLAINLKGWIYAAGYLNGPAVFVSKDHGKSWALLKKFPGKGSAEALFIHPQDSRKICVSTVRWHRRVDGRIYWSENAGQHWSEITGDLPSGSGTAAIAYNPKDSYLYIIRYGDSVYKTKL